MKYQDVTLKLPLKNIKNAQRIAINTKKALNDLDAERAALPANEIEAVRLRGETYKNEYLAQIATLDARRTKAIEKALTDIKEQHTQAEQFVFNQLMPNGLDLLGENAADVALFEHGVIDTPEQLLAIMERHDNAAFRSLASKYAADKGWDDFLYIDKGNSITEYVTQVFNGFNTAAQAPDGLAYMQYCGTENELERIANAHDLGTEYVASESAE